jgi:signal transduction histidine kinase
MYSNGIHISEWVASLDVRKPFYLAIIDKNGVLTFTNSGFYTQFLSSRETAIHTGFFDLVHQGDLAAFKDNLDACALQEEPVTIQIRINNGFCRWVKWEVSCIRKTGQPVKFLCLGYEIADETQLKKAKDILALNYQTIVEDMNIGILLQGAEGEVITANRKAAEILNTTLEELYTRKHLPVFSDFGAGDQLQLPFAETPFAKTLRTGESQTNVVANIQLPGGRYRTLLCNFQPLFGKSKGLTYSVISTFQDITREKEFERVARDRTALLREAEAQLAIHRLQEQKRMADAVIMTQENERTRIGHELHDNINQILASSQLYLNVLNKEIPDFQEIKDKALELVQLAIEEVRILSKALVIPDLKKGGLVASIDDLVHDLRFNDLFEVDFGHCGASDLEEMGQSKKITLYRIIQEQTKNIIKYSHAKKVWIALNVDMGQIRLEIKDDGDGFDPVSTPRGLGLSNIYERTRLNDGKVSLSTSPGNGCCIVVHIPFGPYAPLTS